MQKTASPLARVIKIIKTKGVIEVAKKFYYFLFDKAYLGYRTLGLHLSKASNRKTNYVDNQNRGLFIDAGSNVGQGWFYFQKFYPPTLYDYELFEPNPNCIVALKEKIRSLPGCRVNLNEVAVGTEYETLKFFGLGESEGGKLSEGGSTLRKHNSGKFQHSDNHSIDVQSIDFADFIKQKSAVYSTIVIKMDIEGAEYSVLEKMLASDVFEKIETIFVEFHSRYMKEPDKTLYRNKEKQLRKAIDKTTCKFILWI